MDNTWNIYLWLFIISILVWVILSRTKSDKEKLFFSEWDRIRNEALTYYWGVCSNCWICSDLQVHHKKPRHAWGDDGMENLMVLCKNCHEKEHGYEFNDDKKDSKRALNEKMAVINEAISYGRKIKLTYCNTYKNETTNRIITPLELYKKEYISKVWYTWFHWYIRCYCHLRRWERNFQIRNIKALSEV